MQSAKIDAEKLIQEGKNVRLFPKGYSMYPMFVPGRDEAVIGKADIEKLRRGDVVLYRRASGMLVLHRLYRRQGDQFYMAGDNQAELEGPLSAEQIRGVLLAFVRKGRQISVSNPVYRLAVWVWMLFFPLRGTILKLGVAFMKRWRGFWGKR